MNKKPVSNFIGRPSKGVKQLMQQKKSFFLLIVNTLIEAGLGHPE